MAPLFWRRCGWEAGLTPGGITANDVTGTAEAELEQGRSCKDRGAAVVADQNDPLVEALEVRVAPGAVGIGAPLEHGAGDVERSGQDAVALPVAVGPDVDQQRTRLHGAMGFGRCVANDPLSGAREQVVEGASVDTDSHSGIMCRLPRAVYTSEASARGGRVCHLVGGRLRLLTRQRTSNTAEVVSPPDGGHTAVVTRFRLSWLIAVPLMVAGSFAARAASYVCLPQNGGETGNEATEHVQAGVRGVQWPLLLGVVAALVSVAFVLQVIRLVSGRRPRPVSAWAFFWLPPLAFVGQEIVERVIQGSVDLGPGVLSRLAVGLALQLPFALVALALAFLLLAAATRIARTIHAERPVSRLPVALVQALSGLGELPARWLFPRGHPQRGPPATTS